MQRQEALSRLRSHEAELRRLGVGSLYLFGSTARDEARETSDVDLFFDYRKGEHGLFELMDVRDFAAALLDGKGDVSTRDSLHRLLRPQIEATAERVF